ncbi:MAG: endolytic transglycosylase MltG [Candidatus Liptonbacteria bacterium]|nr:endolytic transglycosylase MltG [Candidatus Liptonbacteria bacterium]
MITLERIRGSRIRVGAGIACAIAASVFLWSLMPQAWGGVPARPFEVARGDGFQEIVSRLRDAGLIRSPFALKAYAFLFGTAQTLKPGIYELTPSMSGPRILNALVAGAREVPVVIPEGSSIYDIDRILSSSRVLREGELVAYALSHRLEGYLFPDTYKLFEGASVEEVTQKLLENFERKARPLLLRDEAHTAENLILASLVEREVPGYEDQRIVAGILKKRLAVGMPLQVDATICYIKKVRAGKPAECYPLSPLDFEIDSAYNTYSRVGFPPQAIGSPGVQAITAVLAPRMSSYWYYLSDPKTGRTIWSETLDEQESNRVKYLIKR